MTEQMDAIGEKYSPYFYVYFRDGVRSEFSSLDEILLEENGGKKEITALNIALNTTDYPKTSILLKFSKTPLTASIYYDVQGYSRDWVYITCSKLEERITRVKKFTWRRACILEPLTDLFMAGIAIGAIFTVIANLPTLDPSHHSLLRTALLLTLISYEALTVLASFIYLAYRIPPDRCFYWGDQIKTADKREEVKKFILIGILATIVYNTPRKLSQ